MLRAEKQIATHSYFSTDATEDRSDRDFVSLLDHNAFCYFFNAFRYDCDTVSFRLTPERTKQIFLYPVFVCSLRLSACTRRTQTPPTPQVYKAVVRRLAKLLEFCCDKCKSYIVSNYYSAISSRSSYSIVPRI